MPLSTIYRRQWMLTSGPLVGWALHASTLALVGPLLGDTWPIYHMGSPNIIPLATRLWLVLHDLVDARTRRDTNTTRNLVMRIALCNPHVHALLRTRT
jgi:hypothetical protein